MKFSKRAPKKNPYKVENPDGSVTYTNKQLWAEAQENWLETHDRKYLWEMYPLYVEATFTCATKHLKGAFCTFLREKCEEAGIYMVEYHLRHPNKRINGLYEYCSFLAMRALYTKKKGEDYTDYDSLEEMEERKSVARDAY